MDTAASKDQSDRCECTVRGAGQEWPDRRFYIWWSALDTSWKFAVRDGHSGIECAIQAEGLRRLLVGCCKACHFAREARFRSDSGECICCASRAVYRALGNANERLQQRKRHWQEHCIADCSGCVG